MTMMMMYYCSTCFGHSSKLRLHRSSVTEHGNKAPQQRTCELQNTESTARICVAVSALTTKTTFTPGCQTD